MGGARKHSLALAALVVISLVSVACGDDDKSSGASNSPSDTTESSAARPEGEPIKVVSILGGGTVEDTKAGADAAVEAINAAGGIGGRPVEIVHCEDNGDANTAGRCARDAANDPRVVAVVPHMSPYGAATLPILEGAGMPILGVRTFSLEDTKSPNVFNISSGMFSSIGAGKLAAELMDAKRIGVPHTESPTGAQLAGFVNQIMKPLGGQAVGAVPIPRTASDFTSYIANVLEDRPDAIITAQGPTAMAKSVQAARQQGSDVPFLLAGGVFDVNQIEEQLGAAATNIYISAEFDHRSEGYEEFVAEMDEVSEYPHRNDAVIVGWLGVRQLEFAVKKAATVDRAGIVEAMKTTSDFDHKGLTPVLDYTKPQPGFNGALPRLTNDALYLYKFEDGKEVAVKGSEVVHLF